MKKVAFFSSVRAKFLAASLLLLLIPLIGFVFVRELASYLRSGQEQVATSAAKLVAASLSDRPEINLRQWRPASIQAGADIVDTQKTEAELERERIVALFAASEPEVLADLGRVYQPDAQVERILNHSGLKGMRTWVVDASGQVRGLSGTLLTEKAGASARSTKEAVRAWFAPLTRVLMQLILPSVKALPMKADNTAQVLLQAQRASIGQPTIEWRNLPDGVIVLSAATSIWYGDSVVAAVVIEETDQQDQSLAKSAVESVLTITLILFVVVFGVLVGFAFRFTSRLSRLQKDANRAIDDQGRVRGEIRVTTDDDEIAALSETLRAMVARQAHYNSYLEQLAARLSHELRTPVAVVRSSLDNLRTSNLGTDDRIFLSRADEGVARLAQIISRMSEATQLERMLQGAKREAIDIDLLIGSCVAGYQQTFTSRRFLYLHDSGKVVLNVVGDAIAQMLDKLVQNAIDFAAEGTLIRITVESDLRNAIISVENKGELLVGSAKEIDALFESMISKRVADSAETHLGLGLYIARLIAEFHGGKIAAENLQDGSGVIFRVTIPK